MVFLLSELSVMRRKFGFLLFYRLCQHSKLPYFTTFCNELPALVIMQYSVGTGNNTITRHQHCFGRKITSIMCVCEECFYVIFAIIYW